MSLACAFYGPSTPPSARLDRLGGNGHSRNVSASSVYSTESSPWSIGTSATSSGTPPPRHQHGPALLPKIRPQDVVIEPVSAGGPLRHRRVLSNTRNPPGFAPYPVTRPAIRRPVMDPSPRMNLVSPISTVSTFGPCINSTLSSPVDVAPCQKRRASSGHSRSGSASSIDDATLSRYGYPTYRDLPKYTTLPQGSVMMPNSIVPSSLIGLPYVASSIADRPQRAHLPTQLPDFSALSRPSYGHNRASSWHVPPSTTITQAEEVSSTSTTLLSYLTGPHQVINLVRNVSIVPTRGLHDYFWWDIRNLRSWTSFSLATFNSISGLSKLLNTEISSLLTPPALVPASSLSPESEASLVNLIRDIYAPRVNAALAVSQGPEHLTLYPVPEVRNASHKNCGSPHFLANYASDTERTGSGLPRGRLVGIVKSFDRWNTGMRNEAPHRRVEYLNGLAHLQRCMREHSCRYGFIMTEIELVCVRAGCDDGDDVPYFGFLEVATPIPTKSFWRGCEADPSSSRRNIYMENDSQSLPVPFSSSFPASDDDRSPSATPPPDRKLSTPAAAPGQQQQQQMGADILNVPMTATLALYFLLMLSKSVPLPSQPSAHLNVGGPGALTRQRVLSDGKDSWIPEPQIGERRDAKRVRGWVWPQDAWHRREGGGVVRSRASTRSSTTAAAGVGGKRRKPCNGSN